MSLSRELYLRCRKILLTCPEFEKDSRLRAVFGITPLDSFRDGLSKADNKEDRVDSTLEYLLSRRLSDNRLLLLVFLIHLRDRVGDSNNALYGELDQLYVDVTKELSQSEAIEIHFVIMAMTQDEAQSLIPQKQSNEEEQSNEDQSSTLENTPFHTLLDTLRNHGVPDILPLYGPRRKDWRPYTAAQISIEVIIQDLINFINLNQPNHPPLQPVFSSTNFFIEDFNTRMRSHTALEQSGCVLIVDAVSLFHPDLKKRLVGSQLLSDENVAVIVLSPIDSHDNKVYEMIEKRVKDEIERAFHRFDELLERSCEISDGNMRALKRWLHATLKEKAKEKSYKRPHPEAVNFVQATGRSNRIGEAIWGVR